MLKYELFSQVFVESGAGHWFPFLLLLAESGEDVASQSAVQNSDGQ